MTKDEAIAMAVAILDQEYHFWAGSLNAMEQHAEMMTLLSGQKWEAVPAYDAHRGFCIRRQLAT